MVEKLNIYFYCNLFLFKKNWFVELNEHNYFYKI